MNRPNLRPGNAEAAIDDAAGSRVDGLEAVLDALRLADHVVSVDPSQLASQLLGRLIPGHSLRVEALLSGARCRGGGPWFEPLAPSLVAAGGPLRRTLIGHEGWVGATAVSADGKVAVSGGDDATVRVWDLDAGSCVHVLMGHVGAVHGVAIAADGKVAVSGGDDATVRVWDLQAGGCLQTLSGHVGAVRSVAVTGDGRIAVSGGDDGTVRIWDLGDSGHPTSLPAHHGRVMGVALAVGGRVAASVGDDDTVAVWDLNRAERTAAVTALRPSCVEIDEAGSTVVYGLRDARLMCWDLAAGTEPTETARHQGLVRSVAVSPDGTTIVTGSDDRTVQLHTSTTRRSQILGEHDSAVGGVAVDSSGRVAVSGCGSGALMVWDLDRTGTVETRMEPKQQAPDSGVCDLAVTTNGIGVSRGTDGTIKTWDLNRWTETASMSDGRDRAALPGRVLALAPPHIIDVAFDPRAGAPVLRVWDPATGRVVNRIQAPEVTITVLAASPDCRTVFAGLVDGRLLVVDLGDGTATTVGPGHRAAVTDIAVTGDGRRLLSASSDGTMGMWDPARWDPPETFGEGAPAATAVAVEPGSRRAFVGHVDGTVVAWNLRGGGRVGGVQLHRDAITSLLVLPDRETVVSTSLDGTVRAWHPAYPDPPYPTFTVATAVKCAAATEDGALILAGGDSGRIHPLRLVTPR